MILYHEKANIKAMKMHEKANIKAMKMHEKAKIVLFFATVTNQTQERSPYESSNNCHPHKLY